MGRHTQTALEGPGGPDPPEEPEQFLLFHVLLTPKNTIPDKHLSDIIKVFFCSDVTKVVCPVKIYIVTSSPFCPGSERPFSPWKTNASSPAMIYHLSAPWWLAAKQHLTVSAQKTKPSVVSTNVLLMLAFLYFLEKLVHAIKKRWDIIAAHPHHDI